MAGILIRIIGLVFAVIQASLLIRLMLPFIDTVPKALRPLLVQLVWFTDLLIAPFKGVAKPFDLSQIVDLPGGVTGILQGYADRIDPAVIVAMIAWGLLGAIVILGLRLIFR